VPATQVIEITTVTRSGSTSLLYPAGDNVQFIKLSFGGGHETLKDLTTKQSNCSSTVESEIGFSNHPLAISNSTWLALDIVECFIILLYCIMGFWMTLYLKQL